MHRCAKCNRIAYSLQEIDSGCPCGSKVFVFDRRSFSGENSGAAEGAGDGKVPQTYYASATFSPGDIENIRVLMRGVFMLDINAISKNPLVLKDERDIYYVKLPIPKIGDGRKEKAKP